MTTDGNGATSDPANAWLVEEMRTRFQTDPQSVTADWQQYFNGTPPVTEGATAAPAPPTPANAVATTADVPSPSPTAAVPQSSAATNESAAPVEVGKPIRGAGARIVANMEASLAVPTATSFREMPAKLLEVNRSIINGYLGRTRGGKVSFTHIIAWAVVKAVAETMPAMNASYLVGDDGKPRVERHEHIGLGIAIDLEKRDGSRTLLVPCIKNADTLSFEEFVEQYNTLITKARDGKLEVTDFAGTTISITNPGTIGTVKSVPRLMPGQGLIVGVGSIAYPTEFQAADPRTVAELGVSKIVTISSTYDHRIIQGAESGLFLQKVSQLLTGEDDFYDGVFRSIGVPYEAAQFHNDVMPVDHEEAMLTKQGQVNTIVHMHRVRGHLIADLDPLSLKEPQLHNELDPLTYGLTIWDLDREFTLNGLTGIDDESGRRMRLRDILGVMRDAYARTVGIEYMHIQDLEEKRWIQRHVEAVDTTLDPDEQRHILGRLNAAATLEEFLDARYPGQKRFGLQGAESAIPLLDAVLDAAADSDAQTAVIGMAHRGRLNVLVNIVGKSYASLFREFEGGIDEDAIQGSGDVKYHLGMNGKFVSRAGNELELELAANPSHLEAVDPVVVGMSRALMDSIEPPGDYPILPVLIHGDAAFAGQGVVAETLNLSGIRGYKVGGTIHLVINNQVGFTTTPEQSRSSTYPTDVARMVEAPIFHVNGDDPEACVRVGRLALEYRQRFNKDVVIDMWCYRRQGHNEGDDPSYTQPLMYQRIDGHRPVREQYVDNLIKRGDFTDEQSQLAQHYFEQQLQAALDATRSAAPTTEIVAREAPDPIGVLPHAETAVSSEAIERCYQALTSLPDGFTPHPKLARQFERRDKLFRSGTVDWALAEAFAFGTLLDEDVSVRLAGQDSRRGTFSHRHSTIVDYNSGQEYLPLRTLARPGTNLWIYDSMLSEYAALGFEYGYSVANKDALIIWEAQFGDFVNGAQIIIDQFIVAAEDKWKQTSGLVMLLPHGFEGQGPEHSSARLERFLLLAAEDNVQIAIASTAAQYFHLLRRQMRREVRKPLILFTPKSLLRARSAQSSIEALTGGTFHELLDDPAMGDRAAVQRLVFCTGKVSHEALVQRDERQAPAAVLRVEQLYPFPAAAVAAAVETYPNATEIVWLQEEPENMGAWNYVKGRFYEAHGTTHQIRRVSRRESGSPATGSSKIHVQEQAQLLDRAFAF